VSSRVALLTTIMTMQVTVMFLSYEQYKKWSWEYIK
jgi:hypothetical protein